MCDDFTIEKQYRMCDDFTIKNQYRMCDCDINPKLRSQTPHLSISYNDSTVEIVESLKYLGLELDQNLNFFPQIFFYKRKYLVVLEY